MVTPDVRSRSARRSPPRGDRWQSRRGPRQAAGPGRSPCAAPGPARPGGPARREQEAAGDEDQRQRDARHDHVDAREPGQEQDEPDRARREGVRRGPWAHRPVDQLPAEPREEREGDPVIDGRQGGDQAQARAPAPDEEAGEEDLRKLPGQPGRRDGVRGVRLQAAPLEEQRVRRPQRGDGQPEQDPRGRCPPGARSAGRPRPRGGRSR